MIYDTVGIHLFINRLLVHILALKHLLWIKRWLSTAGKKRLCFLLYLNDKSAAKNIILIWHVETWVMFLNVVLELNKISLIIILSVIYDHTTESHFYCTLSCETHCSVLTLKACWTYEHHFSLALCLSYLKEWRLLMFWGWRAFRMERGLSCR